MAKQLILTADDFGACEYINEGIYTAIEEGRINTVSAMVTHQTSIPSIEDLVKFKLRNNYNFNIGLHFSITSGYSQLYKNSSLTKQASDGYHYFRLAKRYKFRRVKLKDVEDELKAQLKLLDILLGDLPINHVSNHHGIVYLDIEFYKRFIKTIADYRNGNKYSRPIPVRSPVSWLKSNGDGIVSVLTAPTVRQGIKLGMSKKFFQLTKDKINDRKLFTENHQIRFPDYLVDIIYGQPHVSVFEEVMQCFKDNDFSAEFMFHLGKGDDNPKYIPHGINPIYYSIRQKEHEELLKWDLNDSLGSNGVELIGFDDLIN